MDLDVACVWPKASVASDAAVAAPAPTTSLPNSRRSMGFFSVGRSAMARATIVERRQFHNLVRVATMPLCGAVEAAYLDAQIGRRNPNESRRQESKRHDFVR